MSMTLDEMIAHEAGLADSAKRRGYEKTMERHNQIVKCLIELRERRKAPEIVRCGECKHKKDHHYENPGEEPYIKSTCENKYGLAKNYQVHDWDFCSRAEKENR